MQVDQVSTLWTAVGGVLVFLMVPAIGFLEAGLVRRRNVINGLMKGLLAVAVFLPIWFAVFPIYFGSVIKDGFYPTGDGVGIPMYIYAFFLGVFGAVTLALIFAGAPERLKFSGWLLFAVFFSAVQWPLVASWVWGGGWLASLGDITGLAPGLGVRDFAGGTVVHAYAGLAGLIITMLLGPSLRRYQLNGGVRVRAEFVYKEAVEAKRPELSLAIIGTSLLFFGWFGFNGGSTLVVSEQTGYAIANTAVAGSLGGFVALLLSKAAERAWSPIMAISGVLGGLVMITPLAGFIEPALAFVAGIVAGVLTYYGIKIVERFYVIDDPVGSLPVHGFNGIVGSMLVPVLAQPEISEMHGLIYGGGFGFVAVQWLGMVLALGFVAATTYVFVRLLLIKYRTTHEEEIVGLDAIDHKVGYV